jgi:hypothetical protein
MPRLNPKGLKILKMIHLISASLWLGGAVGLTLINILLTGGDSGGEILGHNQTAKLIDDLVIIPGAIGCLLTGLLYSLFSNWGFFKYLWLGLKWVLTVSCIIFGTFFLDPRINGLPPISREFGIDALVNPVYVSNVKALAIGGFIQLFLILIMLYLSVFKPRRKAAAK